MVINGITMKVSTVASTTKVSRTATYKKEDRSKLSAEKKHDLFSKITAPKQHKEFQLLEPSIQDLDDLDETYQLHMMLRQLQVNFITYDLIDVFKIVFPIRDPVTQALTGGLQMLPSAGQALLEAKHKDLLTDYNQLTLEEVADSSEWYQQFCWTKHTPWIAENLALSADYLRNHIEKKFLGKIDESLDPYKNSPGYGGPLLFIAMMQILQQNTTEVVEAYQKRLKVFKITDYPGENVSDMVSHIRALLNVLKSLRIYDVNGTLIRETVPPELAKDLMGVFQTSSTSQFNQIFQQEYNRRRIEAATSSRAGDIAFGDPEDILKLALNLYSEVKHKDQWLGTDAKGAVFKATPGKGGHANNKKPGKAQQPPTCYNCKGPHLLRDCPKPHNEAEIQKNRKAFFDQMKKKNVPKDKHQQGSRKPLPEWTDQGWPPGPSSGERNSRKIRGVDHYYHFKEKKWKPKTRHQANPAIPHTAGSSTVPSSGASALTTNSTNTRQVVQSVVNNLQSALQHALNQSLQNVE